VFCIIPNLSDTSSNVRKNQPRIAVSAKLHSANKIVPPVRANNRAVDVRLFRSGRGVVRTVTQKGGLPKKNRSGLLFEAGKCFQSLAILR
jgi:hypothetical protein